MLQLLGLVLLQLLLQLVQPLQSFAADGQHLLRVGEVGFAIGIENDAAPCASEEGNTEAALQSADGAAQRGRGETQLLGGTGQIPCARHSYKIEKGIVVIWFEAGYEYSMDYFFGLYFCNSSFFYLERESFIV